MARSSSNDWSIGLVTARSWVGAFMVILAGREIRRRTVLTSPEYHAVLTFSLQAGLTHLIVLRSGDAFFDEPFVVASPFAIFIGTGSRRHFAAF